MKHFLIKRNLTIFGAGGKPQAPPPPIITLYPAVLTPPLLGETENLTSFSYAEMIDLISDGPIEGLINKNGNKLYDENIFEGIYLNDVAIKETSKFNSHNISISSIKESLKILWSDNEDVVKSFPAGNKISQTFSLQDEAKVGVKQYPNPITIESYHPDISITEFIKQTNAEMDLIGTIERAFSSSPIPEERPFLTVINIPKIITYLNISKFSDFEDPKFPIALNIPNIGNNIYFSVSPSSLNSFNYFEMPRSFVFNSMKTSAGKKTFIKNKLSDIYSQNNSVFRQYEFLDIKIFLWSIYSSDYGIKKVGSILDRYFNNIIVYQNQPSLYNYNLVQSEFKNGAEFQTSFQNFKNINIEVDYNKELIGPYKLLNISPKLTDGKFGCGVARIKNICSPESQNFVDLTNESSDDVRYVKNWPVEYNCAGEPAIICNFNFNYASFDKVSASRVCQDAIPVTHYITNQNVKEVYLTMNVNALSDTNHIDLVSPGIGTKPKQTDPPYEGGKTYKELVSPTETLFNTKCTGYLLVVGKNYNDGYVIGGGRSISENIFSNICKIISKQDLYYRSISLTDGFGLLDSNTDFYNQLYPKYNLSSNSFLYNFTIPNYSDPIFTPSFKINDFLEGSDLENKLKNLRLDNNLYYCFGLNQKEKIAYQTESTSWTVSATGSAVYSPLSSITENSSLTLIPNSEERNLTPIFPLAKETLPSNKFTFNSNENLFVVGYEYYAEKINNLFEKYIVGTKINEFINWRAIFNNVLNDGSAVSENYTYKINLSLYPNIKKYIIDQLWISVPNSDPATYSGILQGNGLIWTGTVNGTWNRATRSQSVNINYIFANLAPIFAIGFNKNYFLQRNDIWETDPVNAKEYFKLSFLENLIEDYVLKYNGTANVLLNENVEIINFSVSKGLENAIINYENGKLLGGSSIYSIIFSYIKNLNESIYPSILLNNTYQIRNIYILYPDVNIIPDLNNDIVIKYKAYNNKNISNTNTFKSAFGIAGKGGDASNIKQSISAGTKLPAVVSFKVETGYEKEEFENLISAETYFKYRFDVYGISNGDTLLDIGRKNYTSLKAQKLPSILGANIQNLVKFSTTKNIYFYKLFKVLNGSLSETKYFISDKRMMVEDNIKANYDPNPINYASTILDGSIYNTTITRAGTIGISNNSPYSSENSITYGSLLFDNVNNIASRFTTPALANFNLGGGVFTIEFWINPTKISTIGFTKLLIFGSERFSLWFDSNGKMVYGINSTTLNLTSPNGTLELNKWQHFAFTFDNGTAKLYKNGNLIVSDVARTVPTASNNILYVGYSGTAGFNQQFFGYLADLRITKTIVYANEFSIPTSPLNDLSGNAQILINPSKLPANQENFVYRLNLTDSFGTFFGIEKRKLGSQGAVISDLNSTFDSNKLIYEKLFLEITESQFNFFVNLKKLNLNNSIDFLKQNKFLKLYEFPITYEIDSTSVDPSINTLKVDSYRKEYLFSPVTKSLNFFQTDIFNYNFEAYEAFETNPSMLLQRAQNNSATETPRFVVYFEYAKDLNKNLGLLFKSKNIDVLEIEIFRYWEPEQEYNRNLLYWNLSHNLTIYIRQVDSSFNDEKINDVFTGSEINLRNPILGTANNAYSKVPSTNIFSAYNALNFSTDFVDTFVLDASKNRTDLLTFSSKDVNNKYYYKNLDLTSKRSEIISFLNKKRDPFVDVIPDVDDLITKIQEIPVTSSVTVFDIDPSVVSSSIYNYNVYKTNIFTIPFSNISEYERVSGNDSFIPIRFWTLYNRNTKKLSVIFNKFNASNNYYDLSDSSPIEYIELTQFLEGFDNNYKLYVNRNIDKFYSNNQRLKYGFWNNYIVEDFKFGENHSIKFIKRVAQKYTPQYYKNYKFPQGFIKGNFPNRLSIINFQFIPSWGVEDFTMYPLNFKNNYEGVSSVNSNKTLKILSKIKNENEPIASAALSILKDKNLLNADAIPNDFFALNSDESPKTRVTWNSFENKTPLYEEKITIENFRLVKKKIFLGYKTREGIKAKPLDAEILDIDYYEVNISNSIKNSQTEYFNYSNDLGTQIIIPPPKVKENGETVRRFVKVTKLSHETTSPLIQKRISLQKVTEIIPQNFSYPFSAMIGTKIDSRAFSQLPTRTFHCKFKKVLVPSNYFIEDPETGLDIRYMGEQKRGAKIYEDNWDGSFKLAWTNNPAWILMDLLINKRYGLGNHIESEQIDIWELYKIARWCDATNEKGEFIGVSDGYGSIEPRHTFNGIIEEKYNIFEIVNQVASIFRGSVYYMNSMITFDDDRPKPPAGEFTNSDVKDGIFNYTNIRKDEEFTALDVAFVDERNDYKPSIEYVEDSEAIRKRGILKRNINAFGITSRGQAKRFGKHILHHTAKEKLNISFITDIKALMFKPGDIVQIHDELLTTYKNYGKILDIQDVNQNLFKIKIDQIINSGIYSVNEISIHTPISKPKRSDILSLYKNQVDIIDVTETSMLKNFIFSHLTGHFNITPNYSSIKQVFEPLVQFPILKEEYVTGGIDVTSLKAIINSNKIFTSGIGIENIGLGSWLEIPNFILRKDLNSTEEFPIYTGFLAFNFKSVRYESNPVPKYFNIFNQPIFKSGDYYPEIIVKTGININLSYFNDKISLSSNSTGFWQMNFPETFISGYLNFDSTDFNTKIIYDKNFFEIINYAVSVGTLGQEIYYKDYSNYQQVLSNGKINFDLKNLKNQIINYSDLIESDRPTVETFSIYSYETGSYKVVGGLSGQSGEIPTEYTEIVLNKTGEIGNVKESVLYNINSIPVGSTYSLNLIGKEKFLFKINSINENYVNEYSIMATQYSENKFSEIEETVQYDKIEDTFNQLYYYTRSNMSYDEEKSLPSPIINNIYRFNKTDGKGFGLAIEWEMSHYLINQIKYKIYIKTPSKQTRNIEISTDYSSYNKDTKVFTLYWNGNENGLNELGTYTVYIMATLQDGELNKFSAENSRSVTVLDY